MTIAVIGAAGFVGRNLTQVLAESGERELILFDRSPLAEKQVAALNQRNCSIQMIESADLQDILPYLGSARAILCVAGATSVDAGLAQPAAVHRQNTSVAIGLGEVLRASSLPCVYLSSDEVLGAAHEPLAETSNLKPTQPYAASKACAEIILHDYRDVYGVRLSTVRSCNLVGPGQSAPKFLPVLVDALIRNAAIPIHGTGQQLRQWMHVDDICSALQRLLELRCPIGVFQATTCQWLSLLQVVRIAGRVLKLKPTIDHIPDRMVQDFSYGMSSVVMRQHGWQPKLTARAAIEHASLQLAAEASNF